MPSPRKPRRASPRGVTFEQAELLLDGLEPLPEARASGVGLAYGTGRLMNVIGPLVVGTLLTGYGYFSVLLYIAVCWLAVSAIVALLGPLTTRRSLEAINTGNVGA